MQINEFVKLGGDQLVPYYADILGAILPCIADKEEKIRVVSQYALSLLSLKYCTSSFSFSVPLSGREWGEAFVCTQHVSYNFLCNIIRLLVKLMKNFARLKLILLKDLM